MIIIDTNILAELMRSEPNQSVLNWVNEQISEILYITTITVAEVFYGIKKLPFSKRKTILLDTATTMFAEDFAGRILDFNNNAAEYYAEIVVIREKMGRPIHMANAQIAALCLAHKAALATRNIKDFHELKVNLINPFDL